MTTLFIIGGSLLLIMIALFVFMLTIKFDKDHNASKDSFHYKVFNTLRFGDDYEVLPPTICLYYWQYVKYIVLIPLTLPIVLIGSVFKKLKDTTNLSGFTAAFWVTIILGCGWGNLIFINNVDEPSVSVFMACILGLLILITAFALILLIIYGIVCLVEYIKSKRTTPVAKEESLVKKRFKAWKDKNCPMINWD